MCAKLLVMINGGLVSRQRPGGIHWDAKCKGFVGRESTNGAGLSTVNAWVVYHIGSGQAFFSGIALIQLAGISPS